MTAVGVHEGGGPEALEVIELPVPHAGPGEVRIRVHAAAVNPSDTVVRSGHVPGYRAAGPPPYVPGMDAAGVLDEIGDGVDTALEVGDHVMAIVLPAGTHGAYAEEVVVPVESVARVPAGASDVEASTLPMNGLTAMQALEVLGLQTGQTLAVTGAAGAVGGYVVQLAKHAGLRVLADASEIDEPLVSGFGADVVVRRGDDVAARFLEAAPGGVDGAVDAALLNTVLLPAVKDGGRIACVRPFQGETERGIETPLVLVFSWAKEQEKLDRLRQLVEDGVVTLRVARTIPVADAAEAHRLLEAGGIRGRIVLER
ncbi:MAG: NADP-dependent oxidoreductase [Acidimicrobiales bacterium]